MTDMQIYNITISEELVTPLLAALVMVAAYWFWRAHRAYRGPLRYTKADREAIREKARRRL